MKVPILNFCALLFLTACATDSAPATEEKEEKIVLELANNSDVDQQDALIQVDIKTLAQQMPEANWKNWTTEDDTPFQWNDLDLDGQPDALVLLTDLKGKATNIINLVPLSAGEKVKAFEQRTQAEISHKINGHWEDRVYQEGEFKNVDYLRVPDEHTDHSWFIRYEGPGIESDLVGYRFYLDWRNAVDVFGKKTNEMVLQNVGLDGFDSYHEPSDWGMDILKVGESLGLGSLGYWDGEKAIRVAKTDSIDCRIVLNGPCESMIRTRYFGWNNGQAKSDLISEMSMHGGSRLVTQKLTLSTPFENICTGIIKHEGAEVLKGGSGNYSYLATWGKQSLAEDLMGMAIFYHNDRAQETTQDELSEVVVFRPNQNNLEYHYLATWEQGIAGIKTKDDFVALLNQTIQDLNNPITVIAK